MKMAVVMMTVVMTVVVVMITMMMIIVVRFYKVLIHNQIFVFFDFLSVQYKYLSIVINYHFPETLFVFVQQLARLPL